MVQFRPDTFPLFAEPSFPHPVARPVADTEPDVVVCIPNAWMPYVLGALQQLLEPTTWQGTEAEIQETQADAATLIASVANPSCAVASGVPTPFWDEAQDLDDEETPEAQTWYGEVTDEEAPADEITFVENVGIWVITGFVAYAATPAAAIFFHTVAPRFVHAFHKGDVREIWRIVVDSADYGTVDTDDYPADAIIEVPIVADPEITTGHDIFLISMGLP